MKQKFQTCPNDEFSSETIQELANKLKDLFRNVIKKTSSQRWMKN